MCSWFQILEKDKWCFFSMTKKIHNHTKGYILTLIAAIFWGTQGIATSLIQSLGASSIQAVFLRHGTCVVALWVFYLIKKPEIFKVKAKDFIFLGCIGFFSLFLTALFHTMAIAEIGVSLAATLYYSSVAFVLILSAIFLKEKVTLKKVVCITVIVAGCAIANELFSSLASLASIGVLYGLLTGFFYGLYSVLLKFGLRKLSSETICFYGFAISALCAFPFCEPARLIEIIQNDFTVVFVMLYLGVFTGAVAYIAYGKGMQYIESSHAAVITTLDLPVSIVLSGVILNETISPNLFVGSVIIVLTVIYLNLPKDFLRTKIK